MPAGRWAFDDSVTPVFEDMLRRSIPEYDEMRALCYRLGRRYVTPESTVLDLGCARGDALRPFVEEIGARAHFVGIDVSEPMLDAAREAFAPWITARVVEVLRYDLREKFPPRRCSLVLGILTLQFVPIEYRQRLLANVYGALEPGGAFVVVEKVLGETADLQQRVRRRVLRDEGGARLYDRADRAKAPCA